MQCPKCQKSDCWDNRSKKASGEFAANRPDFSCKDKACGWAQWPDKPAHTPPRVDAPAAWPAVTPPATPPSRDGALVRLYWDCFDEVLTGLKNRSVTQGFPGSEIAACVATLFIARSKLLS